MKRSPFIFFPLVFLASGLPAQIVSAVSIPVPVNNERRNVAKATIMLRESYENVFWSLYDQYEHQLPMGATLTDLLRQQLEDDNFDEARETMKNVFGMRAREVSVRKEFMEKFNRSANGQVALQFLQSEVLHDLIKRSREIEESNHAMPQWNVSMVHDEKVKQSVMAFTLGLAGEDEQRFKALYEDYNFDHSRVVGHQLVWFEQYIEDIAGLTPAQCLKLAREFVTMQANEIKVKESYFTKISRDFGSKTAVRFIQAEEYFDMMAKLKVWSDLQRDDSR